MPRYLPKSAIAPTSDGIVPVKRLVLRSNPSVKWKYKEPMRSSMVCNSSLVIAVEHAMYSPNLVKAPISDGMLPVKVVLYRCKSTVGKTMSK